MFEVLEKLFTKLDMILQTGWGWTLAISLFFAEYFAGHKFVIWLVVCVTLMDAAWGVAVSMKRGRFTKSELLRLTIDKLAVYGCAMFVFVGIDKIVDTTLSASVVGAAIVLVEFWSSCASMLILFPHIAFLRLLKKALTGEIANKLNIDENDVDDVLEEINKK